MRSVLFNGKLMVTSAGVSFVIFVLPFTPDLLSWIAFASFMVSGFFVLRIGMERHEELAAMIPDEPEDEPPSAIDMFNSSRR